MKSVVKNYRTGKEYVEIKHKPDLPIKGRANVYIYNARTGALEVEAHTPNIIYPEVYQWLRSYQWDKFCTGAFNKTNNYSGYWEMDNIFLTASDKPETERINILNYNATGTGNPGQLIGWANKSTYSGSDTQRGTPNSVETYANNSRVHWVFDWPTHAGNGTFQTIIWGNRLDWPNAVILETINTVLTSTGPWDGCGMVYVDGYLYVTKDIYMYKMTTSGDVLDQVRLNPPSGIKSYTPITYDGTYFIAVGVYNDFYKFDYDGTRVQTFSPGIPVRGYYEQLGITCDGTYLYALEKDGNFYTMDLNGTILSLTNTGISCGPHDGFNLTNDGTYIYAWSGAYGIYKLTFDGIVVGVGQHGSPAYAYPNGLAYFNDSIWSIDRDGVLRKHEFADRYFARTLLPSPITKTNQNTMKVIYEFIRS